MKVPFLKRFQLNKAGVVCDGVGKPQGPVNSAGNCNPYAFDPGPDNPCFDKGKSKLDAIGGETRWRNKNKFSLFS